MSSRTLTLQHVLRTLGLITLQVAAAVPCASEWDCSLNGECIAGACHCDAAFIGPTCAQLNLVPMAAKRVEEGAYRPGVSTSWGGLPLRDSQGRYHLYVSELANNCTLKSWIPNSQITHAVAEKPEGPYTFHSTVFNTFHHNPSVIPLPNPSPDEKAVRYLMFLIGGPMNGTSDCSSTAGTDQGETFDSDILISTASAPEGPWSTPIGPVLARGDISEWDYIVTNPSPVILDNGTVLLYFRGTPKYWSNATTEGFKTRDLPESVGLAISPHWSGPYVRKFKDPILKTMNEDPFAWRDQRGFKMLTHGRDDWWNTHFSFSHDGLTWSDGSAIATDPNITLDDGTIHRFTNRERPHIYFNESTGQPAILFNGVCPGEKYDYAYTFAQFFRQDVSTTPTSVHI